MARASTNREYDAVVIGAGPNGLAAAIVLARHGCRVIILEAAATPGGGVRSAELTIPGFSHDACSAVYPLAVASPFLRQLPLNEYGLEWITPLIAVAHPFDDGTAAFLAATPEDSDLGTPEDADAYASLIRPFLNRSDSFFEATLRPVTNPRHLGLLVPFGPKALRSAKSLATRSFTGHRARALFAGLAAHSVLPLSEPITAGVGLVLAVSAHAAGWPIPRGGAQSLADAMVAYFESLGGEVVCNHPINDVSKVPDARALLFDLGPHQLSRIARAQLPAAYRAKLDAYRYGPGAFKVDWALDGPIPFHASSCHDASTIHIGGTLEEITASEQTVWQNGHAEKPYVILAQPSRFDQTRAPEGKHTAWAYCHVPPGSTVDMTEPIENQIERFAPGFKKLIIARHAMSPRGFEAYNQNYVGGDIGGGVQDWRQLIARPVLALSPYATPAKGIYICSSSTPPGGGVHGMCGYHAAQKAIHDLF